MIWQCARIAVVLCHVSAVHQTVIATLLVSLAKQFKYVEYPDFDLAVAQQWLPVNVFFVGMLCSGFFRYLYAIYA